MPGERNAFEVRTKSFLAQLTSFYISIRCLPE
jgi:hypothetical protein